MSQILRSIVYVDGFNLYNGVACAERLNCRWVNLRKYFEKNLLANTDLVAVKFFKALVTGPTCANQRRYCDALESTGVIIHWGQFQRKVVRCKVAACAAAFNDRLFERASEKRTDVAIACTMLEDAYLDKADLFVIVSGDSDFVPAVETLKRNWPNKSVWVHVPTLGQEYNDALAKVENRKYRAGYAAELRKACDRNSDVSVNAFLRSQFDNPHVDGHGAEHTMPEDWVLQDVRAFQRILSNLRP